jgi:hypothetical protein
MNDWLVVGVGVVVIVVARAIARFRPHSSIGQELRRSYGARATGERGVRTRHDHLRSAGLAAIAFVGLFLTAIVADRFATGLPDGSNGNLIASTYGFCAFLLSLVALTVLLLSLWKAAVWRVELPDTPEHRRALADAIDHLLDGQLDPAERANVLQVRYLHAEIEEIRRSTLRLVSKHPSGLPDSFRAQIKGFTATIRASAGPS